MLSLAAYLLLITESEDRARRDLSAEAVRLVPDGDDRAVRARVLATHARMLDRFRPLRRGPGRSALEGLALAERLQLTDHGLRPRAHAQPGPPHRPAGRAARGARTRRSTGARASGAVEAELRGHFLLGRSFEDLGEWAGGRAGLPARDRARRRGRAALRAVRLRVPLAPRLPARRPRPVGRRARPGRGRRVAAADPAGDARRVPRSRSSRRAAVDVGDRLPALRRLWADEGLHRHPLQPAGDEGGRGPTRRPGGRARAPTTTRSRSCPGSGTPWFTRADPVGARRRSARSPTAPDAVRRPTRGVCLARAEELHADGHVVLERQHDPAGAVGPRGAGVGAAARRRAAAAALARRRAAAPRQPWSRRGARPRSGSPSFGDVHELARGPGRCWPRSCAPPATPPAAREVADLAREAAQALGAPAAARRSCTALGAGPRAAAGRQRRPHRRARREILALVAEGRTNGEIGKQLFISTKTVSVHVSNILGKLGASGRTEAAAIARRARPARLSGRRPFTLWVGAARAVRALGSGGADRRPRPRRTRCRTAPTNPRTQPLTDDDMTTGATPQASSTPGDADGTDGDADGTDGDATHRRRRGRTDGDADGTDGDADGTDGDADGTDGDADGTDGDGTLNALDLLSGDAQTFLAKVWATRVHLHQTEPGAAGRAAVARRRRPPADRDRDPDAGRPAGARRVGAAASRATPAPAPRSPASR